MNKRKCVRIANKDDTVFLKKIINALEKKTVKRNGYIPYPEANCVLGRVFHFNKDARHHILYEMKQLQLIEEIPYHGIRILKSGRSALKEVEA